MIHSISQIRQVPNTTEPQPHTPKKAGLGAQPHTSNSASRKDLRQSPNLHLSHGNNPQALNRQVPHHHTVAPTPHFPPKGKPRPQEVKYKRTPTPQRPSTTLPNSAGFQRAQPHTSPKKCFPEGPSPHFQIRNPSSASTARLEAS